MIGRPVTVRPAPGGGSGTAALPATLVLASNRLPVVASRDEGGALALSPGSGGLVAALAPLLRDRGGTWVGWPGISGPLDEAVPLLQAFGEREGYRLAAVGLTEEDRRDFYCGFANEIVWPLFHDRQSICNFDARYWRVYQRVNRNYAAVIRRSSPGSTLIWVHDYHLINVAAELRRHAVGPPIAFFAHIPFPCPDIYVNLPWRLQLLQSFFAYDLVGFQTRRDERNFLDCVRRLLPAAAITTDRSGLTTVRAMGRRMRVGSFPISVDFNQLASSAASPAVTAKAAELRALLSNRQLILGIDRLDYTKGIPQRLLAFGKALERYPQLRERVTLIQVVIPSRAEIPEYAELKLRIERLVGEINGRFTRPGGWVPIHYVFRHLSPDDLLAYYRAAQVGLVTPLKDGMNLVAKEYCACSLDEDCALILSEFAGAAEEMYGDALVVNPYDVDAVADAIARAAAMRPEERAARMGRLRRLVRSRDVFRWVDSFLGAAAEGGSAAGVPDARAGETSPRHSRWPLGQAVQAREEEKS